MGIFIIFVINQRMGNTCCGDGKGRKMSHDSTLKLQGWSRTKVKVAARKELLRQFLASIGNIESPRNPGVKMIDEMSIDLILK